MENNCNLIFGTLVSGRYSIDGLYSGVAAKWGSTVHLTIAFYLIGLTDDWCETSLDMLKC